MSEFKTTAGLTDHEVHQRQLASVPATARPRNCDCVYCITGPRHSERLLVTSAAKPVKGKMPTLLADLRAS